jgi:hypothetical protein
MRRALLPEQSTEHHGYIHHMSIQRRCGIYTMSVGSEFLWVPPPGPDYIVTTPGVLDAFLLLELQNECNIVSIFRIRGEFIHYLQMFWSERVDGNLLMVDDAPGLDVNMFQGPTYHVVIRHESRSCNYLVQL